MPTNHHHDDSTVHTHVTSTSLECCHEKTSLQSPAEWKWTAMVWQPLIKDGHKGLGGLVLRTWSVKSRLSLHHRVQPSWTQWEMRDCRIERRGTGDGTNYKKIRTPCVTKYPSLNNLNSPLLHQKWVPQIPLCNFTNYTPSPRRCVANLLRNLHFRISKNHLFTHNVVEKQLASTVQQWAGAFRVYI